ncbi:MAG: hypothetical protein AAGB34_11355 [Planctomycetota bacterium]
MSDRRDRVEIDGREVASSSGGVRGNRESSSSTGQSPKGWLGMTWNCCSVYSRIYKNRAGTAYQGRCPKCGTPISIPIGPGGTNDRFFEVS